MLDHVTTLTPTWLPPQERIDFYRRAQIWRDASVSGNLRRCVQRLGDRSAVRDSTSTLTFAQIWDGVGGRCLVARQGPAAGRGGRLPAAQLDRLRDRVPRDPHGWWRRGAADPDPAAPGGRLHPRTDRRALRLRGRALSHVRLPGLYAELEVHGPALEEIVVRPSDENEGTRLADVLRHLPLSPDEIAELAGHGDDVALVIYTSGTTAEPKGAIHTHDGINSSTDMCKASGSASTRTTCCSTPLPSATSPASR